MKVLWTLVRIACLLAVTAGVLAEKCANCGLGEGHSPCSCVPQIVKAHKIPKPDFFASADAIKNALRRKANAETSSTSAPYTQFPYYGAPYVQSVPVYGVPSTPNNWPITPIYSTPAPVSTRPHAPCPLLQKPAPPREDSYVQTNCRDNSRALSTEVLKKRAEDDKDLAVLLALPSGISVAPKFKPIGDFCYKSNGKTGYTIKSDDEVVGVIPAYPGKPKCPPPESEELKKRKAASPIYLPVPSSRPPSTQAYSYPIYAPTYYPAPTYATQQTYSPAPSSYPVLVSYPPAPAYTPSSPSVPQYSSYASNTYAAAYSSAVPSSYTPVKTEKSSKHMTVRDLPSTSLESLFESSRGKWDSKKHKEYDNEEVPFLVAVDVEEPQIPADPVSISLALRKLAEQNSKRHISEDQLAFGHSKEPIDGRINKDIHSVDEEKLQTVDRPVVEFKWNSKKGCKDDEPRSNQLRVSYEDVGFGAVSPSRNRFIKKTSQWSNGISNISTVPETVEKSKQLACGPLGPTIPGYKSGGIVTGNEKSNCGCFEVQESERKVVLVGEPGERGRIIERIKSSGCQCRQN